MPYNRRFEYSKKIRNRVEKTLRSFYNRKLQVIWYRENDPINFKGRVDLKVMILEDPIKNLNLQAKMTKYPDTFSIGEDAMWAYLYLDLKLDGLLVGFLNDNLIYLFVWHEFVAFARKNYQRWKSKTGDYYVIKITELTNNIQYRVLECDFD